jgi:hypothetical protein
MGRTASRRVFGFLVAIAAAALPALVQALPATASSNGTLYSLSPAGFLVQLDPAAGTETPVLNLVPSGLPPGQSAFAGGFTADSSGHRLFGIQRIQDLTVFPSTTTYQVLTISPSLGTVTASPILSEPLQSSVVFDSSTGALYGITQCCPNELVRIDPVTGLESPVAQLVGDTFSAMAIDQSTHTLYVASSVHSTYPPPTQLLAVNTADGTVVASPLLQRGVIGLVFDPSVGVIGVTFCCFDSFVVKIDPTSGTESTIAEIANTMLLGSTATIDSSTHTIYVINSTFDPTLPTGPATFITSLNDQTGVTTNGLSTADFLGSLGFLPVSITADSIRADVSSALASGAIDNRGIANSLLVKLNAAAAERATGRCSAAANHYNAFIHEVNAQSGKHIAAATAAQLVSEAQFLVANCP